MLFYRLYPISFFDSNGDGKGTMENFIQYIEYLYDRLGDKDRNRGFTKEVPHSKVLKAQNTELNGATVTLKPQSFVILEN